jgi:hypothetical protein
MRRKETSKTVVNLGPRHHKIMKNLNIDGAKMSDITGDELRSWTSQQVQNCSGPCDRCCIHDRIEYKP